MSKIGLNVKQKLTSDGPGCGSMVLWVKRFVGQSFCGSIVLWASPLYGLGFCGSIVCAGGPGHQQNDS